MDAIEAIMNRKSIRRFKECVIPDEDLVTLLDCARWAPSGTNKQAWEFVVVREKDTIGRIAAIAPNVCQLNEAALLVFFIGGSECNYAIENVAIASYALGYGSCICGAYDPKDARRLLEIPEGKKLEAPLVAIGRADEGASEEIQVDKICPYPHNTRRPFREIVFVDRYGAPFAGQSGREERPRIVGGFRE